MKSISTYMSSRLETIPKETAEKKICTKIASLCASPTLRTVHVLEDEQCKVGGAFAAELKVPVRAKEWEDNHLRPYLGGTTRLKEDLHDGLVVRLVQGGMLDGVYTSLGFHGRLGM